MSEPTTPNSLTHSVPSPDATPGDRRAMLAGLGGLAAGALLAGVRSAHAGPLNPPPGGVGSTGRTTQEIFDAVTAASTTSTSESRRGWTPVGLTTTPGVPGSSTFQITQPGAYYLTGPVDAGANIAAIGISVGDVMLDLNGQRVSASGAGRTCINATNYVTGRRIRNGQLVASNSATALNAQSDHLLVEDLNVTCLTGAGGLVLFDSYAVTIRRCRLYGIGGGAPISSNAGGRDTLLEDVSVASDGGNWSGGVSLRERATLRRCSINLCNGIAISTGEGALIESCVVSVTGAGGIAVGSRSTIVDTVADRTGGIGIDAGSQSLIERCRVTSNATGGIRVNDTSTVRNCYLDLHQTAPQYGIKSVGNTSQILDNAIMRCAIGIDFGGVSGCVAFRNALRLCPNGVSVSFGGNWYPFVDFSSLNTATNPFANLFTNA